jgi:hypothetical protein
MTFASSGFIPTSRAVARACAARAVAFSRAPDACVHLEGVVEVSLGLVVSRQYGREATEPTRDRPPAGGDAAEDDAAISIGQEETVEDGRPLRVAEQAHQVGESRHVE